MPIDPSDLAKSIGALGSLDPERGPAPTLQPDRPWARQLFSADAAGLLAEVLMSEPGRTVQSWKQASV